MKTKEIISILMAVLALSLLACPNPESSDDEGSGGYVPLCPDASALLCDDFEDGNVLDAWVDQLDGYTIAADNSVAADGSSYSVSLSGGNGSVTNGIRQNLSNITPTYISFRVRASETNKNCGFLNLLGGANFGFYLTAGKLADPGGITAENYSADTWYHIEAKNIDWVSHTFDRYVNGSLVEEGRSFTAITFTPFTRIDLYNIDNTQVWFDEILIK